MVVVRYGRDLLNPYRLDRVRRAFDHMEARIEYQQSHSNPPLALAGYWNPYVYLLFQGHTSPGNPPTSISCKDALRIIRATREHFFGYNDNPRELGAHIIVNGQYRVRMTIDWESNTASWPEDRPNAVVDIRRDMALDVLTEEYGRDVDPPLANEVREALGWFIRELEQEGPQWQLINKESYYHAFVKLNVQPPGEGPTSSRRMTRGNLVMVVTGIKEIFFEPRNWAPREFTADVMREGWMHRLGRVTLSFMDS
ncbi:MAG: hypothetical protein Q9184_004889 [Pyrenodesmia sp. 2 TL-2023]